MYFERLREILKSDFFFHADNTMKKNDILRIINCTPIENKINIYIAPFTETNPIKGAQLTGVGLYHTG